MCVKKSLETYCHLFAALNEHFEFKYQAELKIKNVWYIKCGALIIQKADKTD